MSTSAPPPSLFVNAPDPVPRPGAPCHGRKPLPAPAVKDLPQPLTVRCPCGALFGVTVIIRSCYRKQVVFQKWRWPWLHCPSKGIAVDKQAQDDIMHLGRFRKADGLAGQAFNTRP